MTPVFPYDPLQHYTWGGQCDGWTLVETETLSVKREKMPAGSSECLHYHEKSQQFFYILSGTATLQVEAGELMLTAGQGIHITPGKKHRISNGAKEDLEFILSSGPSTKNDRINVE